MEENVKEFLRFLRNNISNIEEQGGGGSDPKLPKFEISPREYLKFAEEELNRGSLASLINCIAHLKHAMDSQIDIFLYSINLLEEFKKKRLSFPKKIEFIEKIGIFRSKSLKKLNLIRNKMEHEYKKPTIEELDLYFDLVFSFIISLEQSIVAFNLSNEKLYSIKDDDWNNVGSLKIEYIREDPKFFIEWGMNKEEKQLEIHLDGTEKFQNCLNVFLLLQLKYAHLNDSYINSSLSLLIKD